MLRAEAVKPAGRPPRLGKLAPHCALTRRRSLARPRIEWIMVEGALAAAARPSRETRCSPARSSSRRFFQRRPRPISGCRPTTARSTAPADTSCPGSPMNARVACILTRHSTPLFTARSMCSRYSGVGRDRGGRLGRRDGGGRGPRARCAERRRNLEAYAWRACSAIRAPLRQDFVTRRDGGAGHRRGRRHALSRCGGHARQWAAPRNIRIVARRRGD